MTRTLVLDLDGTLIDSVPDLLASCNRLVAAQGLAPFTAPEVTAMVGDGAAALVARAMDARGRLSTPEDLKAFLADYTAHAAVETRVYPGAVEALQAMAARGWRFAVCTNKPEAAARRVLDALGLAPFMAAVGGGDSYPTRKPDPAHLVATIADAGGSVKGSVMLGDHHNDMAAAAAAGIPAIFAGWGYGAVTMAGEAAVALGFGEVPEMAEALRVE